MTRRLLLACTICACSGSSPSQPKTDAAATADAPKTTNPDAPPGGLVSGTLAVSWMHGSQNCAANADPEVQVHMYNASTFIIRQNKCDTFEAPFIYVLVGTTSALMLDTGGTNTITLRDTVRGLIGTKPLLVAHSHAHGDHTASDSRFTGQANTTLVAVTRAAVQSTFGITTWPTTLGTYELGNRTLDVLGIPGHEAQHIAIYDRQTGILLTGDTLYPGLLFINDWATYRTTISRLAQFVGTHPISYVLGAHIEMTSTPKQVYPYGTTYQPAEHVLQLTATHVTQLDTQLTQLGATPPAQPVPLDDFVIDPP